MPPRGGARVGAGRPKGTATKVMRVPIDRIDEVKELLDSESYDIPFFSSKVQAGTPEVADDHIEEKINLNHLLITNPQDTFFVRATGDSMIDVGIYSNDTLIVDRSLTPKTGHIVIASVNGELTVKRLSIQTDGRIFLLPENSEFSPIPITDACDFHIWGVVTSCIRNLQ